MEEEDGAESSSPTDGMEVLESLEERGKRDVTMADHFQLLVC